VGAHKSRPGDVSAALLLAAQAMSGGVDEAWREAVRLSMLGNHSTLAGMLRSEAPHPPASVREYIADFVLDPPARRRGALPIEADPAKGERRRVREESIARFVLERWVVHAVAACTGSVGSPQQQAFADAAERYHVSEATADRCFRAFRQRMGDLSTST
jgi:cytochrome c556